MDPDEPLYYEGIGEFMSAMDWSSLQRVQVQPQGGVPYNVVPMEPPQPIQEGESSKAAHLQKQPRKKITIS
jgi:hypothetical protein